MEQTPGLGGSQFKKKLMGTFQIRRLLLPYLFRSSTCELLVSF